MFVEITLGRMTGQLRISFVGDSFVQGVGDAEHRGWVGRVLERTGRDVTGFNLGVRRDTSDDVLARCWREVAVRLLAGADNRLVLSFGSNDTLEEGGRIRVEHDRSLANLAALLQEAARAGVAPLVVSPPPVIDAGGGHQQRTVELARAMAGLCDARRVPFIETTEALLDDATWKREAMAYDGAHPSCGGYQRMADIILADCWSHWIVRSGEGGDGERLGGGATLAPKGRGAPT